MAINIEGRRVEIEFDEIRVEAGVVRFFKNGSEVVRVNATSVAESIKAVGTLYGRLM